MFEFLMQIYAFPADEGVSTQRAHEVGRMFNAHVSHVRCELTANRFKHTIHT